MKKKFMLSLAALFAAASLTITSCGSNPADKVVGMLKDATEQVQKAKSIDELEAIEDKLEDNIDKIVDANEDFKPTDEQQNALREAKREFDKAWRKARRELRE